MWHRTTCVSLCIFFGLSKFKHQPRQEPHPTSSWKGPKPTSSNTKWGLGLERVNEIKFIEIIIDPLFNKLKELKFKAMVDLKHYANYAQSKSASVTWLPNVVSNKINTISGKYVSLWNAVKTKMKTCRSPLKFIYNILNGYKMNMDTWIDSQWPKCLVLFDGWSIRTKQQKG